MVQSISVLACAASLGLAGCMMGEDSYDEQSDEIFWGGGDDDGEKAITQSPDDPDLEWGPCPPFMPESCQLAVLHGNPAEPNTDVFFRMAPDTTVPNHWHTSPERMVVVRGEMHVTYTGQDPAILSPGKYAFGPAEKAHVAYCTPGEECILRIAFEDPVDAFATAATPAPGSGDDAFTMTVDEATFGPCPEFMPDSCGIAVAQGNPAEPNADVFFRMAPHTKVARHSHTSAERISVITGDMIVNYDYQWPALIQPGDYAYGPPGLEHSAYCVSDEECVLAISFEEPVDAFEEPREWPWGHHQH